jgi:hypothetical protein
LRLQLAQGQTSKEKEGEAFFHVKNSFVKFENEKSLTAGNSSPVLSF